MTSFSSFSLSTGEVRSLVWEGDTLVDWLEGGNAYALDGSARVGGFPKHPDLNWVIQSPAGEYQALVQRAGTRGLLQKRGSFLRELTRDDENADAYEYPLVFTKLSNGRLALLHCPQEYNKLVIEDAETGEPLASYAGKSDDYFLSRLQATQSGRYLITAGWFWQPWETLQVYNLEQGLSSPEHFHRISDLVPLTGEVSDAAVFAGHHIAVATSSEEPLNDEPEPNQLIDSMLGIFDLDSKEWVSRVSIGEELGTLHAFGPWLLSLYGHPKLVHPQTGEVVQRWPELSSGKQAGSIIWDYSPPPIAVDEANLRFALAEAGRIHIVQIGQNG